MLKNDKAVSLAGGITGLILFFIFGLLPSILYGGYSALAVATGLGLIPVSEFVIAKLLIVVSMIIFVLAVGGLFVLSTATMFVGINHSLSSFRKREQPSLEK